MSQKYVRVNFYDNETIFIFPKLVEHSSFVSRLGIDQDDVISAGFIHMDKNADGNLVYKCFGKSISLRKESNPSDSRLATRQHYSEMDMFEFDDFYKE